MSQYLTTLNTVPESPQEKKYFTLAEALRALPLVKRVAADIQATQTIRLQLHGTLSVGQSKMPLEEQERLQAEFDRATDRLGVLVEELSKIGVELKDASKVMLDFPALYKGREVLLCWKADEQTITHWHEVDSGFSGRKPISTFHA